MSEKLGRDVGLRTACIDFLENMDQALREYLDYKRKDILAEMGAQRIGREIWDTISDSQPPICACEAGRLLQLKVPRRG